MRYLILIFVVAAAVLVLNRQFPYVMENKDNMMNAIYSGVVLVLVASSLLARPRNWSDTARDAAIWIVILMVCLLGYSYRDLFLNSRIAAELMPSRPIVQSDGTLAVRSGENGHFFLNAEVNGTPVRFMIDTGASDIVLTPQDARRTGYNSDELNFNRTYQTANGIVKGAQVVLDSLEVGGVRMSKLPASVNGAPMDGSLLGMSFLRLFKSYRVEDGNLILTPQ